MILVGLDDTDTADSRGTNQLAKSLVHALQSDYRSLRIVRHQLLFDDRVPYTSKNGSASIWLTPRSMPDLDKLWEDLRTNMLADFIPGSDPGLCLAVTPIPEPIIAFGRRCQHELVSADEAITVARDSGVRLTGLGGTNDGVIGALAAIGLAATEEDGRVVQINGQTEELSGRQAIQTLHEWGVIVVEGSSDTEIQDGWVDVGKKLRPNLRGGRLHLFVEAATENVSDWRALKLT